MAEWFGPGGRGLVLGLWSACQSIGNILGAGIVSAFLQYGYEVRIAKPSTGWASLAYSNVMLGLGLVCFLSQCQSNASWQLSGFLWTSVIARGSSVHR